MTAYIHATLDDTPDFSVYLEAVHRLSDLGAVVTWVSNGTSQAGFEAEWREISIATVEGDLINRSEMFDEADLDAALARFDELSRPAPRLENAASRVDDRFHDLLRGPRLGRDGGDTGRRLFHRRSPSGREHRDPTRSGCRNREHAGRRRDRCQGHDVGRHCDPRGASCSQSYPRFGARSAPRGVPHRRRSASSRSTPTSGSRRASRSTSTTSTPPSRNSTPDTSPAKRPPTRTHGRLVAQAYAAFNRRELPRDDAGLGEHRPPARDSVRARRHDPIHPCHVGCRAGHQHLHRGCASAERSRSGLHPGVERHLARGLRRRVARSSSF